MTSIKKEFQYYLRDLAICKFCSDSNYPHAMEKSYYTDIMNSKCPNINPNASLDSYIKTETREIKSEYIDLEGRVGFEIKTETGEQGEMLIKCEGIEVEFEEIQQSELDGLSKAFVIEINTQDKHLTENVVGYKCRLCSYKSNCRNDTAAHILTHGHIPATRGVYKCSSCDYTAENVEDLDRHVLVHKDPSEIQTCTCKLCDKPKQPKRQIHFPNKDIYKCHLCAFQSKLRHPFKMHQWCHRDPSMRPFQCETCGFRAKSQYDLRKHKIKHIDPSELEMFRCDLCDFQARFKADLTKHISRRHSAETKTFKCYHCKFETKYKYNLRIHVFTHKDTCNGNLFQCDECGRRVSSKKSLENHKLTHVDPSQLHMFDCNFCQYQTKYKEKLTGHIKLRHTDNATMKDKK